MSKQIDKMVDRFLGWKLPIDFGPDCYISFNAVSANRMGHWPVGTNLLTADQARQMFEYVTTEETPEGMQPHQYRVVIEKAELDEKLAKLLAFFQTPIFAGLSEAERSRLRNQARFMYELGYDNFTPEQKEVLRLAEEGVQEVKRAMQLATPLTSCACDNDGECSHAQCPQLRDDEPARSGRSCPLYVSPEEY